MFGWRKKQAVMPYNRGNKIPVIRSSICTGEQVAGFKDPVSGRFEEVMLLRNDRDLHCRLAHASAPFLHFLCFFRGRTQVFVTVCPS